MVENGDFGLRRRDRGLVGQRIGGALQVETPHPEQVDEMLNQPRTIDRHVALVGQMHFKGTFVKNEVGRKVELTGADGVSLPVCK